jgi:hypothetical protein
MRRQVFGTPHDVRRRLTGHTFRAGLGPPDDNDALAPDADEFGFGSADWFDADDLPDSVAWIHQAQSRSSGVTEANIQAKVRIRRKLPSLLPQGGLTLARLRPPHSPRPLRRPFVEEHVQVRMPRGAAHLCQSIMRSGWPYRAERVWVVTLPNPWDQGATTLEFDVLFTKQRLGGGSRRTWFVCRGCGRRCGVLLSAAPGERFRCRRCCRAVYQSDYLKRPSRRDAMRPRRHRRRNRLAELHEQLVRLTAPQKKGIRRGRHLKRRIATLRGRVARQQQRMLDALFGRDR